jgi:5-methylcytosine-specific restriction protein A
MASEPLCRYCFSHGLIVKADVLDHILALSLGGANEVTNYAPACTPCNALKAKVEQRLSRKGYSAVEARLDPELAGWLRAGFGVSV